MNETNKVINEKVYLTQYEQLHNKMDKILEIFKFDKDRWECKAGSKDDEVEESLSDINTTLTDLDLSHEFTKDSISELQKDVYENHKDTINAIESQIEDLATKDEIGILFQDMIERLKAPNSD